MANPIWDGQVTYLTWVTTSTNSWNIAKDTGAICIILPDFGTDTTCTVQLLDPIDQTTWRTVNILDVWTAVTPQRVLTLAENSVNIIPAGVLPIGTYRLTNANTQAGLQAKVIFGRG